MIVLVLTAVGVASAVLTPTRIRRLARLHVEALWLVWAAFITQIVLFEYIGYYIPVAATNVLHLATYGLCLAFMYRNRHLPGAWIIATGACSNLLAIVANRGTMPADADAWAKAGLPEPTAFENSSFATDAHLGLLGDVFYVPAGWPLANVFSVGDILIVIGGTYLAHRWCATGRDLPGTSVLELADAVDAAEPTDAVDAADAVDVTTPIDLESLVAALDDLRDSMHRRIDAVEERAIAARSEAAALCEAAGSDVAMARQALIVLLDDLDHAARSGAAASADAARLDDLGRSLEACRSDLARSEARQQELASMLSDVIDIVAVDATAVGN